MDAAPASERCRTCGGAFAVGTWCARCALDEVLAEETPEHAGALFTVEGHAVLAELGRGAAGIVYRARQERPAREVALKILRPHEAGSAESRARFRLEATTVAGLDHPAILPVLSVGEHDGLPYFTMKLCVGGSLAERIARYRGAWRESATLVATLADAVHHAHQRGVLHRDLKPGNILFDEAERAFVSDFGIAKSGRGADSGAPVTQPLSVMGTRGYVAPEVLREGAGAATLAVDVYGLGAILQELLTGAPPAENAGGAVTLKGVPRDLAVIAAKCLQPEPAARYASAAALAEDLRAWLAGRPIAARPVSAAMHAAAWARRNPVLAALALALGVTLAGGAAGLAVKNGELRAAFARSQASLADALVAQARAVRQSGRVGQRLDALKLLALAAKINPSDAARDEAAAALALPDWTERKELRPWAGESADAAPSADFTRVLVEDDQMNFSLRETATGAVRWVWHGSATAATMPVFSPDGRWVAVRLQDDVVQVLAVADGKPVLRLEGREYAFKGSVWGFGHDMDFSPDGTRLAVTRTEGGVSFHRLPGGEADGEWAAAERVTVLAFSPDGTKLAVGGGKKRTDRVLAVVETSSGRTLARQTPAGRLEFLVWSPDGRWLATRADGGLTEVRAAGDLAVRAMVPDKGALYGRFLADGRRLLLGGQLGRTRLWEIDRGQLRLEEDEAGRPGSWYAGEPVQLWRSYRAGPAVLTTLGDSPVWRAGNTDETGTTVPVVGGAAASSADGRFLAVGGWQGGAIYDVREGRTRAAFKFGGQDDVGTVKLDEAGGAAWVALSGSGLWRHAFTRDARGGWGAPGAGERVDAEAGFFCADLNGASGRLALVRPDDGTVKIVDVRTRAVVARWTHAGAASAAFSPDGGRLAVNARASGGGQGVAVHDTLTGAVVWALGREAGDCVAWSADGRWIYGGEAKTQGALWRAADGTRGPELMTDATDWIRAGAFSPDGRWLALGERNAGVRLVEAATGKILVRLTPPEALGYVPALAFAGNERLCAVGIEGRVHTWDLAALRRELGAAGLDWSETAARR